MNQAEEERKKYDDEYFGIKHVPPSREEFDQEEEVKNEVQQQPVSIISTLTVGGGSQSSLSERKSDKNLRDKIDSRSPVKR